MMLGEGRGETERKEPLDGKGDAERRKGGMVFCITNRDLPEDASIPSVYEELLGRDFHTSWFGV